VDKEKCWRASAVHYWSFFSFITARINHLSLKTFMVVEEEGICFGVLALDFW
jgi:hypothetical protein